MSTFTPRVGGDLAQLHGLERLALKSTTTPTVAGDLGLFRACVSSASIDRERDVVEPSAMVNALRRWATAGRKVPLAWNHSAKASDICGWVDPSTATVSNGRVLVDGWIDQASDVGKHAWRLVKSGTGVGFSYGFLIPEGGATPRPGGGRHIRAIDLYEISICGIAPMNADTGVISWKTASAPPRRRHLGREPLPLDQLKAWSREVEDEWATSELKSEAEWITRETGYDPWMPSLYEPMSEPIPTRELRKRCEAEQMESGSGVGDYKGLGTSHAHAAMVERAKLDMLAALDGDA